MRCANGMLVGRRKYSGGFRCSMFSGTIRQARHTMKFTEANIKTRETLDGFYLMR